MKIIMHAKHKLAIISSPFRNRKFLMGFSLTVLLLFGIVGIKFPGIVQRQNSSLGTAEAAQSFVPDPNSPVGKGEHPRLYITSETLPTLRQRVASTHSSEYQTLLNLANNDFNKSVGSHDYLTGYYYIVINGLLYQLGEIPGFTYIHTPAEYGNRAAVLVEAYADRCLANPGTNEAWSSAGVLTYALSIGYDWANNLLTPEVKTKIMNALILVRNNTAIEDRGDFIGIVQRSVPIGGLAFYGDGVNDAKAQEYVNLFDSLWRDGTLPADEMISNGDGGFDKGNRYGKIELNYVAKMLAAWKTATGENLFETTTWMRYFPYWLVYIAQARPDPADGLWKALKIADDTYTAFGGMDHMHGKATIGLIASVNNELGDTDLASLATWFIQNRMTTDTAERHIAWELIWYDKTIPAKPPSQINLSLTRKFSGIGEVIMRTGFESQDDTVVAFLAQPFWYSGHSQIHQNSFIIERKGESALDSGQYEYDNTTHEWNYSERTVAHNTITIYNPAETLKYRSTNDGGQRGAGGPLDVSQVTPGSQYDIGGIKRFETVTDEYDYILGDATRAYNSTLVTSDGNIPKISNFTRQFIYFRPQVPGDKDTFVVFDRVNSTNASFVKKWLLHMPFEPNITGSASPDSIYPWHTVYDGDLVEFNSTTNQGKIFSKTLLPEAHRIIKIGGPGYEFESANGDNWPLRMSSYKDWMGAWRVEVEPTEARTDDIFLHVLEAADAGTLAMSPAVRIDAANMAGVLIDEGAVAMFSRTESNQTEVIYSITSSQEVKHLIADFEPLFTYNIYQDGVLIDTKYVEEEAGIVYFISQGGGTFQITQGQPNLPPTITSLTADPTTGQAPLTVSFTVQATDPDGNIASYSWDFGDGGTSTEQNPSHIYNTAGNYTAQITVTDNGGAGVLDTISISVTGLPPSNQAPVLSSIGNKQVKTQQELGFIVTATDPDGDSLTYSASNLPPGALFNTGTQKFTWTPTDQQVGTYSGVHFEVSDGKLSDSEDITITVSSQGNIIDIQEAGRYNTPGTAWVVSLSGDYAYVADQSSLQIINISNPSKPAYVSSVPMTDARGVFASGNYAYVGDKNSFKIIDVSNPASPVHVGSYPTAAMAKGVWVRGSYAYLGSSAGLEVVNVSDPANPTPVTSITGSIYDMYAFGDYLYTAGGGMSIYNISNPASPVKLGSRALPNSGYGVYSNSTLAVAGVWTSGISIIDVSNPVSPSLITTHLPPDVGPIKNQCGGTWIEGQYAFAACDETGLWVIDILDPVNPVEVGYYEGTNYVWELEVRGQYVYLANMNNGLVIVDVSDFTGSPDTAPPNLTLTKSALVNGQSASEATTGDIITYTIAYKNIGAGEATNVVITDPIPAGTIYETDSARFASGPTGIIDDTTATIKWTISSVPAGTGGSAGFKARVE